MLKDADPEASQPCTNGSFYSAQSWRNTNLWNSGTYESEPSDIQHRDSGPILRIPHPRMCHSGFGDINGTLLNNCFLSYSLIVEV